MRMPLNEGRQAGRRRVWCDFGYLIALAVVLALAHQPAFAETVPQTAPLSQPKPHVVTGFRSASFGMTEPDVVAALKRDFGVTDRQISHETNMDERTNSLVVRINNLIPDAGTALIAYVFGATSKRLFQINIVWGQPVVEKPELPGLVSAANSLRNLFLTQGYAPDTVVANAQLPDGTLLVFRGLDAQGHMTLLLLALPHPNSPSHASGEANAKPKTEPNKSDTGPATLRLSYIEKPEKPDIFKLDGGF
jgi:hypothetical protein